LTLFPYTTLFRSIIFASAELTTDNGGLIEGALAAAERAARIILPG
jgi:monoamine oxidase